MLIKVLAVIFIAYRLVRIAKAEKVSSIILEVKDATDSGVSHKVLGLFENRSFSAIFLLDMCYMVFMLKLLISDYWFVGLLLIALFMIFKGKRDNVKYMVADSALTVIALLLVLFL